MTKKKRNIVIIWTIFITAIFIYTLNNQQEKEKDVEIRDQKEVIFSELTENVKVGQVYINIIYEEDPFKEIEIDTITILDIKQNYIKYKRSWGDGNMIKSGRRDWVIYSLDSLIKDVD